MTTDEYEIRHLQRDVPRLAARPGVRLRGSVRVYRNRDRAVYAWGVGRGDFVGEASRSGSPGSVIRATSRRPALALGEDARPPSPVARFHDSPPHIRLPWSLSSSL